MIVNEKSRYCANCVYSSDVVNNIFTVTFKDLVAAGSIGEFDATSATGSKDFDTNIDTGSKFGRVISVVAETSGVTDVITIKGFDYLMQPMTETITLNGTTAVAGKKAFKTITCVAGVPNGHKVTISTTTSLGLPYRTTSIIAGTKSGVKLTTLPTLTAPVITAQTATTGDPRGTVAVSDADVVLICVADSSSIIINDEVVGGLFGIPHYTE